MKPYFSAASRISVARNYRHVSLALYLISFNFVNEVHKSPVKELVSTMSMICFSALKASSSNSM